MSDNKAHIADETVLPSSRKASIVETGQNVKNSEKTPKQPKTPQENPQTDPTPANSNKPDHDAETTENHDCNDHSEIPPKIDIGMVYDVPTDYAYQTYRELQVRYMILKRMYVMSSSYYHKLNIFMFVMPILISQLLIAIMPVFFQLNNNPQTASTITSIMASITGVYLGLQQKLRWTEKSQKWATIANLYDELTTRATYLKKGCRLTAMTHVKHSTYIGINKPKQKFVNQCEPYCRKHCPSPSKQQTEEDNRLQLLAFLNDAENLEKTMTAAIPIPPYWIKRKCYEKIEAIIADIKKNKIEVDPSEKFETDEFFHLNTVINDANQNDPFWMRCWTG